MHFPFDSFSKVVGTDLKVCNVVAPNFVLSSGVKLHLQPSKVRFFTGGSSPVYFCVDLI